MAAASFAKRLYERLNHHGILMKNEVFNLAFDEAVDELLLSTVAKKSTSAGGGRRKQQPAAAVGGVQQQQQKPVVESQRAKCVYVFPENRQRAGQTCGTEPKTINIIDGEVYCRVHYDLKKKKSAGQQQHQQQACPELERKGKFVTLKGTRLIFDPTKMDCSGVMLNDQESTTVLQPEEKELLEVVTKTATSVSLPAAVGLDCP